MGLNQQITSKMPTTDMTNDATPKVILRFSKPRRHASSVKKNPAVGKSQSSCVAR